MNVYQKLNEARDRFHKAELKKSGHNKFAGYSYFELSDFVVPAIRIFKELDLTSVISFGHDEATMTIVNCEKPDETIVIKTPMSTAALKGCHEVQNLGAVETYLRRYLWVAAMEIVEHDALDSTTGAEKEEQKKPEKKVVAGRYEEQGNRDLFIKSITEWATTCGSQKELMDLWKANQVTIDQIKSSDPSLFNEIKELFAKIKSELK